MSTRYAILIDDGGGNTIVSDIKQMEGAAPDVGANAEAVKVPDGVLIGMIKGGPVDAVGGYGFAAGTAGKTGRSPVGVTKADDAPAKTKPAKTKPAKTKPAKTKPAKPDAE
jgi:hypothetical protein